MSCSFPLQPQNNQLDTCNFWWHVLYFSCRRRCQKAYMRCKTKTPDGWDRGFSIPIFRRGLRSRLTACCLSICQAICKYNASQKIIFLQYVYFFAIMTVRTTKTFPFTPKRKPPMVEIGGFLFQFFKGGPAFRLTAQVLPIQPFANVVRNYTRHDG